MTHLELLFGGNKSTACLFSQSTSRNVMALIQEQSDQGEVSGSCSGMTVLGSKIHKHVALPPYDRQRLKEVFADARALPADRRPAYLAAACAGNEALRQEVESLLSSDERAKSFLETPAVVLSDDTRVTRSLEGQRIGPYQIASRIGAGGMGEVYQARDTTLNRQVAIKVLLPAIANDPDRLARFRREAQVLASLNHPHIAQIHGFEDAEMYAPW